jgi:hypothetical protein
MKMVARLLAVLMAVLVCVGLGIVFICDVIWPDLPHARPFGVGGLVLASGLLARLVYEERHLLAAMLRDMRLPVRRQ